MLKNDGLDGLLEILLRYAEEGPHFFEDDAMTDQPERVIVAEIIREKILLQHAGRDSPRHRCNHRADARTGAGSSTLTR